MGRRRGESVAAGEYPGPNLVHRAATPARIGASIAMNKPRRSDLRPGLRVRIVLKRDQRTGSLTEGVIANLLTKSPTHPHGIKVRLEDGQVGRVQETIE